MPKPKNIQAGDEDALLKIKSDALRLLSFRPRSEKEMRQRLKLKRYPETKVNGVIDFLKARGFLDDEKFAKLYATSRTLSRPSGLRQLQFELERKGIAKDIVAKTLDTLTDYDEREAARQLVALKFAKMSGVADQKKKSRLFGFLKRRGFSNGIIFDLLQGLFDGIEDPNT